MKLGFLGVEQRTPSAGSTAVAVLAGGARPTGIAMQSAATKPELAESCGEARSATTESVLEESPGEDGSCGSGASAATSAATAAVARSEDEDRPPGIAKNSATSKGDAGSSWSRDGGTTIAAAAAADAKSVAEAWPREIAKQSATTKPKLAESSGEAGSPWFRAGGTTNTAAVAAVAMLVVDARPQGFAKHSATTDSDIAVSSGEAGPSWSRANGDTAAATVAVKSAGKDRPSRIVRYSVTSESESALAESSDEESSPRKRVQPWTANGRNGGGVNSCQRWREERGTCCARKCMGPGSWVMLPSGFGRSRKEARASF